MARKNCRKSAVFYFYAKGEFVECTIYKRQAWEKEYPHFYCLFQKRNLFLFCEAHTCRKMHIHRIILPKFSYIDS